MTGPWFWLLLGLVVAEAAGLVWLAVGWQRARSEVVELTLQRDALVRRAEPLRTLRQRGIIPSGRDAVRAVWDTANLVRERGFTGAIRSSIDDLAAWARVEQPDLVRLASGDGTLTILFSDIEGSTSLNEELGDQEWVRVLEWHDRQLRARITENDGHVVKTQGDGFMVAFADPIQAVRCAIQFQRDLARKSRKPGRADVRVRVGIHRGEAVHRSGDLFGRNVAAAARVGALADGGQVLVTDPVLERLDPDRVVVLDTEEVELKGLDGTHRVHALRWDKEGHGEVEPEHAGAGDPPEKARRDRGGEPGE